MKYLVCEHRQRCHDKAVIHVDGRCWPQSDPGITNGRAKTEWFGYYATLGDALQKALDTGRLRVTKCGNCFRPGDDRSPVRK
ncbi:MAG: hypothetical protein OXG46_05670 [Chloroflexi bacterium]|nr:hypothetical protein [Chloroflexota bacterium]